MLTIAERAALARKPDTPPAPIAAAVPEPTAGLCPEEETSAALARLRNEERQRLTRVWEAFRLELVMRNREFARTMAR